MKVIYLLLALQLLALVVILSITPKSNSAIQIRHALRNVLGSSIISQDVPTQDTTAQDQTPAPDNSNPQPTDQPSTQPADTSTPSPSDNSSSANQVNPDSTNPNTSPLEGQINTQPSPEISPSETPSAPEMPNPSDTPTPTAESSSQLETQVATGVIINSEEISSTPQEIDDQAQNEAISEDKALGNATPEQEFSLLTNYATNKISGIENNIQLNDYSTVSFLIQRLNDQIDQTQKIVNANPAVSLSAKQNLKKFCNQADSVLKTEQLAVPEELEQDIEIARSKCLNLQ